MKNFYSQRFNEIQKIHNNLDVKEIIKIENIIRSTKNKNKKIFVFGNGGSSSTASHFCVDLSLNLKIKAINFNEYNLITCYANDFGYENWVKKVLEKYSEKGDLLILISCSGNSMNLVNGNKFALKKKLNVLTLTGCQKNNKLRKEKNLLNLWVNSKKYNIIEIIHHMILLNIIDKLSAK